MSARQVSQTVSGTAPSSASSAIVDSEITGLSICPIVAVTASLTGNTGGTLDVYIQRWDVGLGAWIDWARFPQLASGAAEIKYTTPAPAQSTTITEVGEDATPAIAANTCVGGHPGDKVRVWAVSGTSTTAGGAVVVSFQGLAG